MKTLKKVTWIAPEYDHRKKTNDWFWALGIIAISTSVAAIIFENYLFAVFILLGTILIFVFSVRKPQHVEFEINERGIKIEDVLYPFKSIKGYWIEEHGITPKLLLHTKRFFLPIISIPFERSIENQILGILSGNVDEMEMRDSTAHKILEYLGF